MRLGAIVLSVLALAFAAREAHAFTASEITVVFNAFDQTNLSSSSETVPHALMDANRECPCLSEVGCVRTDVVTSQPLSQTVNVSTIPGELLALFTTFDTLKFSQNTNNAVGQCVSLKATGTGCPAGSAAFGTSECGACTDAGMVWCPGTQYMPPSCFDASAAVRTFPANVTSAYTLQDLFNSGNVFGTAQTYGLTRDQLLSFDPSLGGCPFSATDTPVALTENCPATPVCENCTLQPGGSCACESAGCCTEERGFWKRLSTWPEACAPDVTRDTAFFGTSTMGAILAQPPQGDVCVKLAHAYITAKLNMCAYGACTDIVVDEALASAEAYLFDSSLCPGNVPKKQKKIVRSIASTLNAFNSGIIGPGSCSEVGVGADAGFGVSASSASATESAQTGLLVTILVIVGLLFACFVFVVFFRRSKRG